MNKSASVRATTRRTFKPIAIGFAAVAAALIGSLVYQLASSSAPSFSQILRGEHGGTTSEADGGLPARATVFDDRYPGVANLDPDLLRALRAAARDAADDG